MNDILDKVIKIAVGAGDVVLEEYNRKDFNNFESKKDGSPLTEADKKSSNFIVQELKKINNEIPIITEELQIPSWEKRKKYTKYWLVDPLDGTKEFLKRNGEFTVNIALIENQEPIIGVVNLPVKKIVYFALKGAGAYKRNYNINEFTDNKLNVSNQKDKLNIKIVGSRSHTYPLMEKFLKEFSFKTEFISVGSSLKFCIIAEGNADIYPRFGPTSEWDTAAAQIVLFEAGGHVMNLENFDILKYNTKESCLNPFFLAITSSKKIKNECERVIKKIIN